MKKLSHFIKGVWSYLGWLIGRYYLQVTRDPACGFYNPSRSQIIKNKLQLRAH